MRPSRSEVSRKGGERVNTCVIVCAGGFSGLMEPLDGTDCLIAADGGLAHLEPLGLKPKRVLGDFDSLGYVPQGADVFPAEKDDTDAMLAARQGLALGFRRFVLYGCMDGPRLDHTVAAFQTLQFLADRGAQAHLAGVTYGATLLQNGRAFFPPSAQGILSVFCINGTARGVTLEGVKYPLTDHTLTSGFPLGVSNHFMEQPASVSVEDGSLLLLYDRKNGLPQIRSC